MLHSGRECHLQPLLCFFIGQYTVHVILRWFCPEFSFYHAKGLAKVRLGGPPTNRKTDVVATWLNWSLASLNHLKAFPSLSKHVPECLYPMYFSNNLSGV